MIRRLALVGVLLAPLAAVPHQTPVRAAHGTPRRSHSAVESGAPVRDHERRQQVPVTQAAAARAERDAARANRSHRRPPLAERSRWSTPAKPAARHSAPRSTPGTMAAARSATRSSATSDLDSARSLPEPWRSIVRCESLRDGSWRVTSASHARGWFQFLPSTWRSLGLTGDPASASFSVQYGAARRLAQRDGLRAWDCARILGWA